MERSVLYLRKSRADAEAEARGEGETLSRHRKTLLDLAERMSIHIKPENIYTELVSGDTIASRPMMQRLLQEVEAGLWDSVLVMDIDRLTRGDPVDQGIMAQAFKYSGTRIITPYKIYDPESDTDEIFMEFGLFMARQEYRAIKRRLQAGRLASVKEGRYIGGRVPYGYERFIDRASKLVTLKIIPEKAAIVRQIYEWYLDGVGAPTIADRLHAMGLRSDLGNRWEDNAIRYILRNPLYVGMVQWNQKKTIVSVRGGERTTSRKKSDEYICVKGQHEPIVSKDVWDRVQTMFSGHQRPKVNNDKRMMNPLSGLIKCGVCGRTMVRRNCGRRDELRCTTPGCSIVTTYLCIVEDAILDTLSGWTKEFVRAQKPDTKKSIAIEAAEAARKQQISSIETLRMQMARLHDLLERGIYSEAVFLERSAELSERIKEAEKALAAIEMPRDPADAIRAILPQIRTVVAAYKRAKTPEQKNELLKSVLDHVDYFKDAKCSRNGDPAQHVTLRIIPRQRIEHR